MTDCTNNGSFVFVRFVLIGCSLDIPVHHIEHAPYSLLYEAVFELKGAGFKLDVTRVGPKLTQSVNAFLHGLRGAILKVFVTKVGRS